MNLKFKLKIQENFIFQMGVANFLVHMGMEFREKNENFSSKVPNYAC